VIVGARLGALALAGLFAGCAITGGALGGRSKCWDQSEPRLPSLMKGNLELGQARSILATPEGDQLVITFATMVVRTDESAHLAVFDGDGATVASDGELVTVFGGLGDGDMVVCAIEERYPGKTALRE
jgi:hypothetical protein